VKHTLNSNDVFVVDQEKNSPVTSVPFGKDQFEKDEEFDVTYCMKGYNDTVDELGFPVLLPLRGEPTASTRKEACARKTVKNTAVRYFVRISNRGEWLNPLDRQFVNYTNKVQNNIPVWKFVQVSKTAFEAYITFLKTQNPAFFSLAKRSI